MKIGIGILGVALVATLSDYLYTLNVRHSIEAGIRHGAVLLTVVGASWGLMRAGSRCVFRFHACRLLRHKLGRRTHIEKSSGHVPTRKFGHFGRVMINALKTQALDESHLGKAPTRNAPSNAPPCYAEIEPQLAAAVTSPHRGDSPDGS